MASAFAHAFVAVSSGSAFGFKSCPWRLWFCGIFCAVIPDIDILAFEFGIPYESFWGHRGFTHSLVFASLLAALLTLLFFRREQVRGWIFLYLFFCGASHGLLDAMTNGGLGVAFFSPFDNARHFLPWRPIRVSPVVASRFFTLRGLGILQNEAIWIGLPCLGALMVGMMRRRRSIERRSGLESQKS